MYVEDVEDIKTSHNRCILKYVKDVEDRSNTPKGCNACTSKILKQAITGVYKMSKIDQIHLRAVCMDVDLKILKQAIAFFNVHT